MLAFTRSLPNVLSVEVMGDKVHSPPSVCVFRCLSEAETRFQQAELVKSNGYLSKKQSSWCETPALCYYPSVWGTTSKFCTKNTVTWEDIHLYIYTTLISGYTVYIHTVLYNAFFPITSPQKLTLSHWLNASVIRYKSQTGWNPQMTALHSPFFKWTLKFHGTWLQKKKKKFHDKNH